MWNLVKYAKQKATDSRLPYRKVATVVLSSPYSLCKGMKNKLSESLAYFEYFKIEKVKEVVPLNEFSEIQWANLRKIS